MPRSLAFLIVPLGLLAAGPAPAAPPATSAPGAPIFDKEASGLLQIEATARNCAGSKRRMLVVFGTEECERCRVVNAALYEPDFFKALIKQFVPVFIDVSAGSPNLPLLKRYEIDPAKGMPAVVIGDPASGTFEITKNGEMVEIARRGPEAVRDWLLLRFHKSEE